MSKFGSDINTKKFDENTGKVWGVRHVADKGYVTKSGEILGGENGEISAKDAQDFTKSKLSFAQGGCNFTKGCCNS